MNRDRILPSLLFVLIVMLALVSVSDRARPVPTAQGTPTAPAPRFDVLAPYVANEAAATPYPTPTQWIIPHGATERPTSRPLPTPRATATRYTGTRAPTWTPAQTQTPYPLQGDRARTMSVSVYVPMAGGINGGACVRRPWAACFVQTGGAACGSAYPRGTVFVLADHAGLFGLPLVVQCIDRGSAIGAGNLDIALVSGDVRGDLSKARAWGRRLVRVGIVLPRK